jgi:hypothetical protein
MELTKKNLIQKKDGRGTLRDVVIDYILEYWDDYENKEDIFLDVKRQGYHSRIVKILFPYSRTEEFYNKHKREINSLLSETMWETGLSPSEIFGDEHWLATDPLCLGINNQNLLVRFGFVERLTFIGHEFDIY